MILLTETVQLRQLLLMRTDDQVQSFFSFSLITSCPSPSFPLSCSRSLTYLLPPVALAVDWIHDKLFWILEDDHIFDVEQIVEYDLITMDEARVVTNLSVTTVQWLAVYPFPDNG